MLRTLQSFDAPGEDSSQRIPEGSALQPQEGARRLTPRWWCSAGPGQPGARGGWASPFLASPTAYTQLHSRQQDWLDSGSPTPIAFSFDSPAGRAKRLAEHDAVSAARAEADRTAAFSSPPPRNPPASPSPGRRVHLHLGCAPASAAIRDSSVLSYLGLQIAAAVTLHAGEKMFCRMPPLLGSGCCRAIVPIENRISAESQLRVFQGTRGQRKSRQSGLRTHSQPLAVLDSAPIQGWGEEEDWLSDSWH